MAFDREAAHKQIMKEMFNIHDIILSFVIGVGGLILLVLTLWWFTGHSPRF